MNGGPKIRRIEKLRRATMTKWPAFTINIEIHESVFDPPDIRLLAIHLTAIVLTAILVAVQSQRRYGHAVILRIDDAPVLKLRGFIVFGGTVGRPGHETDILVREGQLQVEKARSLCEIDI